MSYVVFIDRKFDVYRRGQRVKCQTDFNIKNKKIVSSMASTSTKSRNIVSGKKPR